MDYVFSTIYEIVSTIHNKYKFEIINEITLGKIKRDIFNDIQESYPLFQIDEKWIEINTFNNTIDCKLSNDFIELLSLYYPEALI